MQFRDQEYYRASLERMRQALMLAGEERAFALAMYCSGLAVECLLRAFRWKDDKRFEGRHDLSDLLRASRIFHVNEAHLRRKGKSEDVIYESTLAFRAAMNEIVILWHNNLRFASEARLKAWLVSIHRVQGIKGDPLKKNATDLINAAQHVVNRGEVLWKSLKKS